MLTAKENMRQVILGGDPDRLVNQYEAIQLLSHPFMMTSPKPKKGEKNVVNAWGVTYSFPENVPASFPVHTPDKIVIRDIENWRDYVKAPSLQFSDEQWDTCRALYANASDKAYKAVFVAPGLFEQCHNLMSMEEALTAFYEYPDEMHELIEFLTDWELELARGICENLHPDMLFHHDDWGSEMNSFFSPAMFREFFLEPYKRLYGYYKTHGVEFVVHHSDSFCANLLPTMIEMGIDVWQGCMASNDVPALIERYGGNMTFMGDIDNKAVDFEGWTQTDCEKAALRSISRCASTKFYIPCITQGGPGSLYPGTYAGLWDAIDEYNCKTFGFTKAQLEEQRPPMAILF